MALRLLMEATFTSNFWYYCFSNSNLLNLIIVLSNQRETYKAMVSRGMLMLNYNSHISKQIMDFVKRGDDELHQFLAILDETNQRHVSEVARAMIRGDREIVPKSIMMYCVYVATSSRLIQAITKQNFVPLMRKLIDINVPVATVLTRDILDIINSKTDSLTPAQITCPLIYDIVDVLHTTSSDKFHDIVSAMKSVGLNEYAEKLINAFNECNGKCPVVTIHRPQ